MSNLIYLYITKTQNSTFQLGAVNFPCVVIDNQINRALWLSCYYASFQCFYGFLAITQGWPKVHQPSLLLPFYLLPPSIPSTCWKCVDGTRKSSKTSMLLLGRGAPGIGSSQRHLCCCISLAGWPCNNCIGLNSCVPFWRSPLRK